MASMILNGGKKSKAGSDIEKAEPSILESITPTANTTKPLSNPLQPQLMDIPKGNEADMQKVRDYQIKLNKKGAGLVVDGVWGEKTKAASIDYYNKYQKGQSTPKSNLNVSEKTNKPSINSSNKSSTMKLAKGDTEFKPLPDTSDAESYFKDKKGDENYAKGKIHTLTGNETKQERIRKNKWALDLPQNKPEVKTPSKSSAMNLSRVKRTAVITEKQVNGDLKSIRQEFNAMTPKEKLTEKGKTLQNTYMKLKNKAGSWADGN